MNSLTGTCLTHLLGLCISFAHVVLAGHHLTLKCGLLSVLVGGQASRDGTEVLLGGFQGLCILLALLLHCLQTLCCLGHLCLLGGQHLLVLWMVCEWQR